MNSIEQLQLAKGKLSYVSNLLTIGGLDSCAAKEYALLEEQYKNEIRQLQNHIAANPVVFA